MEDEAMKRTRNLIVGAALLVLLVGLGDAKGNLWIGGNGGDDGHVLKFTKDGKFVKQFGFAYAHAGSNDPWAFNKVAKISIDDAANEAYVADGYGNHRVAVLDMDSGKIK